MMHTENSCMIQLDENNNITTSCNAKKDNSVFYLKAESQDIVLEKPKIIKSKTSSTIDGMYNRFNDCLENKLSKQCQIPKTLKMLYLSMKNCNNCEVFDPQINEWVDEINNNIRSKKLINLEKIQVDNTNIKGKQLMKEYNCASFPCVLMENPKMPGKFIKVADGIPGKAGFIANVFGMQNPYIFKINYDNNIYPTRFTKE